VIDAASSKKAEDVLSLLRKALGSLPVMPLLTNKIPGREFTNLLRDGGDNTPANFVVLSQAELSGPEGEKISLKDQNLFDDDVQSHLNSGKTVTKIKLYYDDMVSFLVTEDLLFKGLQYSGVVTRDIAEYEPDSEYTQFNADGVVLAGIVGSLYDDVIEFLGGMQQSALDQTPDTQPEPANVPDRTEDDPDDLV
jgi:recombination associated protein RdgC